MADTSATLEKIKALVSGGRVLVSAHGYDEMAADDIFFDEIVRGLAGAEPIEDYPFASKGPSVLVLQTDSRDRPVHVVWGIPKGASGPAVLATAYRPDPVRWSSDFRKRKKQ
jgi:hypothetical protein